MKNTKRIEAKARKIARLIAELHDDALNTNDPHISDTYRGYILGTEDKIRDSYLDFANRLDYSISQQ